MKKWNNTLSIKYLLNNLYSNNILTLYTFYYNLAFNLDIWQYVNDISSSHNILCYTYQKKFNIKYITLHNIITFNITYTTFTIYRSFQYCTNNNHHINAIRIRMVNEVMVVDIHGAMNKFPACASKVVESNSNTSDLNQCEAYCHCDIGICNLHIIFNVS